MQMFTLNARIEAARQSAQGSAFATIADEMRELAGGVKRANLGIGELSVELTASARTAEVHDERVQQQLADAEKQMGADLASLLSTFENAQSTSAAAVHSGIQRAEHLAVLTDEILSHLQFQDRMRQICVEAARNVGRACSFTSEIMERADEEDHDLLIADVRAKAALSTVRLSQESELSSSDLGMESGFVTMF